MQSEMKSKILKSIESSIDLKKIILEDIQILSNIELIVEKSVNAFKNKNKILLCGNGGSAADAQHIASELSGKFYKERRPLFAEALHLNPSFITAVANDYGFDYTYARMIDAAGKDGDILIALSTSGSSKNVINAIKHANIIGMTTIGLTGEGVGEMNSICNITINIPSSDVPRIQESHMLIGHIICELIEKRLF